MKTRLQNYPLTTTTIVLETRHVHLTLIEEPDWFFDQLSRVDNESKLYLPYWTYLWEASLGLAQHIEKIGMSLKSAQVLEIGCGFGLTGIVACQLGARAVFIDVEQDALHFARHNAGQNGVSKRAEFVQMDWRDPCFNCQFSYILAADVVYEESHWLPILTLLQAYLAPNGIALFSEPNRNNALGFFKLINDNGFSYQKSIHPVRLNEKTPQVSIYAIERR